MSVIGFEEQTHELTAHEKTVLLPLIIKGLECKKGAKRAVTATYTTAKLRELGHKIGGPRWRKIINYIRINSLIPGLVSTSKGYYIAESQEEMRTYLESLKQRINSITMVYDSIEYQLKTYY